MNYCKRIDVVSNWTKKCYIKIEDILKKSIGSNESNFYNKIKNGLKRIDQLIDNGEIREIDKNLKPQNKTKITIKTKLNSLLKSGLNLSNKDIDTKSKEEKFKDLLKTF